MNERNPAYERNIFGTQLGDSKMERSGSLHNIRSRAIRCGRAALFKKVRVECIRNLGTVGIGDGPMDNQDRVPEATINSPHSCNNSTESCKNQRSTKMNHFVGELFVAHCRLASAEKGQRRIRYGLLHNLRDFQLAVLKK